jgi:hypothetical protein
MHSRAKTISDSMANLIQTALNEAKMQQAPPQVIVTETATSNTSTSTPK